MTSAVPEETGGPYPGDGSNGPNYLGMNGAVRSDIRSSLGSSAAVAGVPITIKLTVLDLKNSAKPLTNAGIYLWHCNQAGQYSMYSQGVTNETFCRGIQPTDSNGTATFTSVWPGAYSGRWPHIHFEVYPSVSNATSGSGKLKTSQIAMPEDACDVVYATDGYSASIRNMAQTSLSTRHGVPRRLVTGARHRERHGRERLHRDTRDRCVNRVDRCRHAAHRSGRGGGRDRTSDRGIMRPIRPTVVTCGDVAPTTRDLRKHRWHALARVGGFRQFRGLFAD